MNNINRLILQDLNLQLKLIVLLPLVKRRRRRRRDQILLNSKPNLRLMEVSMMLLKNKVKKRRKMLVKKAGLIPIEITPMMNFLLVFSRFFMKRIQILLVKRSVILLFHHKFTVKVLVRLSSLT